MTTFSSSKKTINRAAEVSPELIRAYARRLLNRRKSLGFSQRDLAKKIGVSLNTIQSYESGRLPRGEHFLNLAKSLKCSLDWLVGLSWPTTEGDDAFLAAEAHDAPPSRVSPPFLEIADQGGGTGQDAPVNFERKWLASIVSDSGNARLLRAAGPAMRPTFCDGDLLLVDIGRKRICQGMAYAIRLDGGLLVNRLEIRPGGVYRIISDNCDLAPPYEAAAMQVEIIGQVVWSGGVPG